MSFQISIVMKETDCFPVLVQEEQKTTRPHGFIAIGMGHLVLEAKESGL